MNVTDAYKYYDSRLKTFDAWPKQMTPDKYRLAKCGFVYSGKGDKVTCFRCGLHLKDWERNDDPWQEHYKWSSQCDYLNMTGWNRGLDVPDTFGPTQGLPSEQQPVNWDSRQQNQPSNHRVQTLITLRKDTKTVLISYNLYV
jgi:hypothetical protein